MVLPAVGNYNCGLCIDSFPDIDYNQYLQHHHNMAADKFVKQVLVRMKWDKVQY